MLFNMLLDVLLRQAPDRPISSLNKAFNKSRIGGSNVPKGFVVIIFLVKHRSENVIELPSELQVLQVTG